MSCKISSALLLLLGMFESRACDAQVTYEYTGPTIRGWLTLQAPPPAGALVNVTPTKFSFTGAFGTVNDVNTNPDPFISIAVDSQGNVTQWWIALVVGTSLPQFSVDLFSDVKYWAPGTCGYSPFPLAAAQTPIYEISVSIGGGGGCADAASTTRGTWSNLPPPTNVSAIQVNLGLQGDGKQIEVHWDYSGDPSDSFTVERQAPAQADSDTWDVLSLPVQVDPNGGWLVDDDTVAAFGTYTYRVQAHEGGADSPYSEEDTCFQLHIYTTDGGAGIVANFRPDQSISVSRVASLLGYDHFNWIQVVEQNPTCFIAGPFHQYDFNPPPSCTGLKCWVDNGPGVPLSPPFYDPAIGGYFEYGKKYLLPLVGKFLDVPWVSDDLPYYWDEATLWYADPTVTLNGDFSIANLDAHYQPTSNDINFEDKPSNLCLFPAIPINGPRYMGFATTLVGVKNPVGHHPAADEELASFVYHSTYNSLFGGISTVSDLTSTTGGIGGIFNVSILKPSDLAESTRILLSQSSTNGVPAGPPQHFYPPTTAVFLSGLQGSNDWYRGPVNVTLIATDVTGPQQIASTTLSTDGGGTLAYQSPFEVTGDGTHSVEFGSTDISGLAESPRPEVSIKIDATPPMIDGMPAAGCIIHARHRDFVQVGTISASDVTSGMASFSVNAQSNEPNDPNDRDDIQIVGSGLGPRRVLLRANLLCRHKHHSDDSGRTEDGDDATCTNKVYNITASASDNAGNTSTRTATCAVVKPRERDDNR
jgi:hypothetical protein